MFSNGEQANKLEHVVSVQSLDCGLRITYHGDIKTLKITPELVGRELFVFVNSHIQSASREILDCHDVEDLLEGYFSGQ